MRKILLVILSFVAINGLTQELNLAELLSDLSYRDVGPSRGGRVTTVAGIETSPGEFYMGATGGGVWKTTNYGQSWKNVSDGSFATGSIGAIRVAPTNPDVVYVGTGSDGMRSNVIIGKGIYKSTDAGDSWNFIGLKNVGQIGAVEVHPDDENTVYLAAIGNPFGSNSDRGVFKTTNGGESWEQVLYISDKTGVCDLEICPDNPNILYASAWTVERKPWTIISGSEEGGVFKSSDAGKTWTKLSNGLPDGIVGKSDLAVCMAEPGYLYVLMEAEDGQNGLYMSEDYGESFKRISDYRSLLDRPFYYCNIDVDPSNPNKLYVNTTGFHHSIDQGKSWRRISTPHGDNHDMWINPSDPNLFIQSNDGGANVTRDGGNTWSPQSNQPTAELYQVNVDDQFPYWLYAGQQDNSTLAIPSTSSAFSRRGANNFISVGGCETGPAVPKPGNHNIVYANCKGRFGVFNKVNRIEKQYYVGGQNLYGHNPKDLKYRFQRVAPIYVSPHNPDVVYHGSQYLHKTNDDGVTWETISPDLTAFEPDKQVISGSPITRDITGEEYYSTLYSITESPLQEGILWVGSNDGPIHVSLNGGDSWENVTPSDLPPGGRVQTVEASPHQKGKAYVAVLRYQLDDWRPHIYRTNDYGQTWQWLTSCDSGFPIDHPTRVIREDPDREGLLYAGTEFGLFISFDDGTSWHTFQQNLPVVPITDIKVHQKDLVLSTMGRSFWIMDDLSPLHQFDPDLPASPQLFSPRAAYRSRDTRGATIDYYLPDDLDSVKLHIKDANGNLVSDLRPAAKAGFHRTSWSISHDPVWSSSGRGRSYGIKAIPGTYTVVLQADEVSWQKSLIIKPDPRIVSAGMTQADFVEQFELCLKVQELMGEARSFKAEVDSLLKDMVEDKGKKTHIGEKEKVLKGIKAELDNASGPYPQNMLLSQISYLNGMISRADQKPGKDAYIRYEELKQWLTDLRRKVISNNKFRQNPS